MEHSGRVTIGEICSKVSISDGSVVSITRKELKSRKITTARKGVRRTMFVVNSNEEEHFACNWLAKQPSSFVESVTRKLLIWWQKCAERNGIHTEKYLVPVPFEIFY